MKKGDKMEWISVKDRLPEIEDAVLVYHFGQYCVMMRLKYKNHKGETEIKWSDGNLSYAGVECWMPLPPPPSSPNKE